MSHNKYFLSERALTSLLPLTSNYPTAYLAIPDCSGRATAACNPWQPFLHCYHGNGKLNYVILAGPPYQLWH
jgi:hypothetical protein